MASTGQGDAIRCNRTDDQLKSTAHAELTSMHSEFRNVIQTLGHGFRERQSLTNAYLLCELRSHRRLGHPCTQQKVITWDPIQNYDRNERQDWVLILSLKGKEVGISLIYYIKVPLVSGYQFILITNTQ